MEKEESDRSKKFPVDQRHAGFWIRVTAYILDAIVLWFIQLILGMDMIGAAIVEPHHLNEIPTLRVIIYFAMSALIFWLYFALMESSKSQGTVGKMAMGLKVVDENGERLSFGKATVRFFAKVLSTIILFIGFIMVAFNHEKQALHDKIAHTFVVFKKPVRRWSAQHQAGH